MKKYFLSLILFSGLPVQAAYLKKMGCIAASAVAMYPMLKAAYNWHQNINKREMLIDSLDNIEPQVESFVRRRLELQGYDFADILPIKSYEDFFGMETKLDHALVFSKVYEERIKSILEKIRDDSIDSLDENEKTEFGNFIITLDHEMFHIQQQHARQSMTAQAVVPFIVELLVLPLTLKIYQKNTIIFAFAMIASIPLKWLVYKALLIKHRRSQEWDADEWALNKNSNIDDLEAFVNFRQNIPRRAYETLLVEHAETGKSRSVIFNLLMLYFKNPLLSMDRERGKVDTEYVQKSMQEIDTFYNKLINRPYSWPIRLLSYEFDADHPFVLDAVEIAEQRIQELQKSDI